MNLFILLRAVQTFELILIVLFCYNVFIDSLTILLLPTLMTTLRCQNTL